MAKGFDSFRDAFKQRQFARPQEETKKIPERNEDSAELGAEDSILFGKMADFLKLKPQGGGKMLEKYQRLLELVKKSHTGDVSNEIVALRLPVDLAQFRVRTDATRAYIDALYVILKRGYLAESHNWTEGWHPGLDVDAEHTATPEERKKFGERYEKLATDEMEFAKEVFTLSQRLS